MAAEIAAHACATAWKIATEVGDTVAKGQVSMILEAMQTVVVVDP
jgi:biotin carboxyl carrier protein